MKRYFFLLMLILPFCGYTQKLHVFATGGVMNYQGDLQAKKITFSQAQLYYGAGVYYKLIRNNIFIKAGVVMGEIGADDKYSEVTTTRNLNFKSKLVEGQLGLEYDIFDTDDFPLTPFIYGGLAAYHFNPYTKDKSGNTVFLQPLGTEGQGFGGKTKYSLTQLSLPFGGGIKAAISPSFAVRAELVMRKLLTDYLDDVSSVYADKEELLANNGALAVKMAYRGDELGIGLNYPTAGKIRGNPKAKDFYYTIGLTLSYTPNFGDGYERGGSSTKVRKKQLGCPKNVF